MAAEISNCLDAGRIRSAMNEAACAALNQMTLLQEVDSTNAWLLRLPADRQQAHAVLADSQTGGRGRRQRRWHSPAGGNIYLSLGWRFQRLDNGLATLPLLVGICLCRALAGSGLEGHGIKWPNDILAGGKKLAGILVEMQSAPDGPALAVIGMGINVSMPQMRAGEADRAIDRPWTDLASNLRPDEQAPDRNLLVADLLNELLPAIEIFQHHGFEHFKTEWEQLDLLNGHKVVLNLEGRRVVGRALGVDDSGGLRVAPESGGAQVFHSGEVSIGHA